MWQNIVVFQTKKGLVMERRVWGQKTTPFLTCAKSGGFGASRRERSEPSVWEPSDVPRQGREVGSIKV